MLASASTPEFLPKGPRAQDANRLPVSYCQQIRVAGHQSIGAACQRRSEHPTVALISNPDVRGPRRTGYDLERPQIGLRLPHPLGWNTKPFGEDTPKLVQDNLTED